MKTKKIVIFLFLILIIVTAINAVSANENMTENQDLLEQKVLEENMSVAADEESVLSEETSNDSPTIEDRTFKTGKYQITLSEGEYLNFVNIIDKEKDPDLADYEIGEKYGPYTVTWDTYNLYSDDGTKGLSYSVVKNTGKTVKQKIGIGFKGYKYKHVKTFAKKTKANKYKIKLNKKYKLRHYVVKKVKIKNKIKYKVCRKLPIFKKVATKNAKVYMSVSYGNCQQGVPGKYVLRLYTQFENPGYTVVSGWISCYKLSNHLLDLNSAKVIK